MRRKIICSAAAAVLAAAMTMNAGASAGTPLSAPQTVGRLEKGPAGIIYEPSFEVEKFKLPEEAAAFVVVEGTFGAECYVHAFEKGENGWEKKLQTNGWFGHNGLSWNRTMGDNTTPVGVFQMNTPFGQSKALEGFPANYIQVDSSYVWADDRNALCRDLTKSGERVGVRGYWPMYEYVIDMGYNRNAVPNKGSALFIHCKEENEDGTAGCVAIDRDSMIAIMRLYGKYGDGRCYIALAPFGTFDKVYETYGTNNGLSPVVETEKAPEQAAQVPLGPLGPLGAIGQQ